MQLNKKADVILTNAFIGISFPTLIVLLLSLFVSTDAALPFKKVSIAKTPASTSTTTTTTEAPEQATEKEELPQSTAPGEEVKVSLRHFR